MGHTDNVKDPDRQQYKADPDQVMKHASFGSESRRKLIKNKSLQLFVYKNLLTNNRANLQYKKKMDNFSPFNLLNLDPFTYPPC